MPDRVSSRREEAEQLRTIYGDLVPTVRQGTPKQVNWAQDIATRVVHEMPAWLWRKVKEVIERNEPRLFSDSSAWISLREAHGFLVAAAMTSIALPYPQEEDEWELVAIFRYADSFSSTLNDLMESVPKRWAKSAAELFRPVFPARMWGNELAAAYLRIDPEADVASLFEAASEGPQMAVLSSLSALIDPEVAASSTCGLLLNNGTYMIVVSIDIEDENLVVQKRNGDEVTVPLDSVYACFVLGDRR